jgi:cytochrome c oxidase subunit 1/cytochrome c oxidase subunit I+III
VQVFAWIATLWRGRPVMTTAMHFCLGFIAVFVVGGLSGVITAIVPFDWQITDTYFVVAHLHYVLIGANLFPVLAALYYWFPKMSGRLASERAGRWSFWLVFVGFNVAFFPMHISGLMGMPRRVWTYPAGMGWDGINLTSTIGAYVLALGLLVAFVNFLVALRQGERAGRNPWNAPGLEWEVESPPPSYGTVHIPTVVSRYSGWDGHDSQHDPDDARVLDGERLTYTTSVLDAVPIAIARMPEDTVLPLACALAVTVVFTALLLQLWWLLAGATLVTLVCTAAWLWPQTRIEAAGPP